MIAESPAIWHHSYHSGSGASTTPDGGIEPGNHHSAYWHRPAPAQHAFVGRHL